ncbi:MAG: cytochrome c [Saprospiraceae bacterium]|nr:cytochrome c [Saprospiraceae bacterium]
MKKISFLSLLFSAFFLVIISCDQKPPKNSRVAQAMRGKALFMEKCVQCHGEDGKGLKLDTLATQPADLTEIMWNRRVKEFPILEIANIIDGRKMAEAHGTRAMPIWGEVFAKEEYLDEKEIKGKMAELIAYLMSIQGS